MIGLPVKAWPEPLTIWSFSIVKLAVGGGGVGGVTFGPEGGVTVTTSFGSGHGLV